MLATIIPTDRLSNVLSIVGAVSLYGAIFGVLLVILVAYILVNENITTERMANVYKNFFKIFTSNI